MNFRESTSCSLPHNLLIWYPIVPFSPPNATSPHTPLINLFVSQHTVLVCNQKAERVILFLAVNWTSHWLPVYFALTKMDLYSRMGQNCFQFDLQFLQIGMTMQKPPQFHQRRQNPDPVIQQAGFTKVMTSPPPEWFCTVHGTGRRYPPALIQSQTYSAARAASTSS